MDIFLMVQRKKQTLFLSTKENANVLEVKKMIEGILKRSPEDQQLIKDGQILVDNKVLSEYGLTTANARAQMPAAIGLCLKLEDGTFEKMEITPLSTPPELPDVMRSQETGSAVTSGLGTGEGVAMTARD